MFIKRNTRRVGKKTYVNHLLVESVATPKGPRHRVICSLGKLEPAPRDEWLALARRIEAALGGQQEIGGGEDLRPIVERARRARAGSPTATSGADVVAVHTDRVEVLEAREGGAVHVAHQMWRKLSLDSILADAGLSERARLLSEVMTINRLTSPCSEHAMPDWIRRTALADILKEDFSELAEASLYRNLDRLHPRRAEIETALAKREESLFNLDDSFWLYDLTSTYFEGQCLGNPQAKRGYSRDQRPDCKQVVVGLVLSGDGFPKAHEVFDGNRNDRTTLDAMLATLEKRTGKTAGSTVVVDRGMAYEENLAQIKARGHHYIVASRQGERAAHLDEFEDDDGWSEVLRESSPRNPAQNKSRVRIKRRVVDGEVHILCKSAGRENKDRAIREKHEKRLLADLDRLRKRIETGKLAAATKIHEAIGRLRERYPRAARYYEMTYEASSRSFRVNQIEAKKEKAERLDGAYMLKTDRTDLTDADVWKTYILLTRVESAFRSMKSPLMERPIFHQLEHRVQTHIFLCVLAFHLLVAIEKMFLDRGVHTSWATLRDQLSTHQVVTVELPAVDGSVLSIRRGSKPEPIHEEIYETLNIPAKIIHPVKTWRRDSHSQSAQPTENTRSHTGE